MMRARHGMPATMRRPGSHTWFHGLPLKLRFKRSKIYVSVIPVWAIGFIIGFVGAIMGIGGGFLLVPMLIYFLRVPTATVIGTSMVLTLVTMASATVHACGHQPSGRRGAGADPDGRRRGRRAIRRAHRAADARRAAAPAARPPGSAVGLRFAYELVAPPDDLFSIRHIRGEVDAADRAARCLTVCSPAAPRPAAAERLVVSLSNHRVQITSNFVGEDLVLFGTIEPDRRQDRAARELRSRGHRDRPARDPPHAAQGARGSASGSMSTRANSCACRPISPS